MLPKSNCVANWDFYRGMLLSAELLTVRSAGLLLVIDQVGPMELVADGAAARSFTVREEMRNVAGRLDLGSMRTIDTAGLGISDGLLLACCEEDDAAAVNLRHYCLHRRRSKAWVFGAAARSVGVRRSALLPATDLKGTIEDATTDDGGAVGDRLRSR
ncbi:hypothetical protein ACLOJK_029686 [Asimina triloba]